MTPGLHTALELARLLGWDWGPGIPAPKGEPRVVLVSPGGDQMFHVHDTPVAVERVLLMVQRERAR